MASARVQPVSFFLNETHELARAEKDGGGGVPKLAPIDWAGKGNRINSSLGASILTVAQLADPTLSSHLYLLAKPQKIVKRLHESAKFGDSIEDDPTSFAGKDSRVFTRLGMEMLRVTDDGSAVIHVTPSHARQLQATASTLADFGAREQSRWITVDSFEPIPVNLRIDEDWLQQLPPHALAEAVIELQPLLSRQEVDTVFRALFASVQINAPAGQAIRGSGMDFSGRQWLSASLTKAALDRIANSFISVQSLHSPLLSSVSGSPVLPLSFTTSLPTQANSSAPRVAVVDTGVPANHSVLAPFRKGEFRAPYNQGTGQHASFVASRVVFGDLQSSGNHSQQALRFFDVNVGFSSTSIDDKQLIGALQAVVGTSPDVRVFNLSFDNEPLALLSPVVRAERLLLAQDLDNFAFQNDILLVISAGNTRPGLIPTTAYPNHFQEESWHLGAYACSFNSLTCGSFVSTITANPSVVNDLGWPSPFCRVGPGLAGSFKPDFAASGGNATPTYNFAPGMGVPGLDANGQWVEKCGTSFAAPLLAREAALAFQLLDSVAAPGNRPYAATVKAFLALTAIAPASMPNIKELVARTMGYGLASSRRLSSPLDTSAVFIWQGLLEDKNDLALIQVPVPRAWLSAASKPRLRVVFAADVPVNAAAAEIWASRKISIRFRPRPDIRSLTAQKRRGGDSYPLVSQEYSFARVDVSQLDSDFWIMELSYEQLADYLPSMAFAAQQRVAFAAELYDEDPDPASPQALLQALPAASSMNRLSAQGSVVQTPVTLRY